MKGQPSVNDLLEVGPNLNPEILEVLLRFRLHKIGWTADVTKAFLQIALKEEDQETIRFLWVEDPDNPESLIVEYTWLRVPFGLSCSPFLLRAVILKQLEAFEGAYPDTVESLRTQLYVDDWIGGSDVIEKAAKNITEAIAIFKDAKMELRKWTTNSDELRTTLLSELSFVFDYKLYQ